MRFDRYQCGFCGCLYFACIIDDTPKHSFCPCCENDLDCQPKAVKLAVSEREKLKWYLCSNHYWDDVVIAVGSDYEAGIHSCPVCGDICWLFEPDEIYFGDEVE